MTMKAQVASSRRSVRVAYLPTKGVSRMGSTPMGAVAMPDHMLL